MCGICGFCINDNSIDKLLFEKMTDILEHRGPDSRGTWYDDNIALGHRRLSIIDLTEDGAQPMHYMDKYVIVYNGEVYNYAEIKEELEQSGYSFKSKTDTEVIVAAFDKWGVECLHKFNGMWAFSIYDRTQKKLFCARDRYGVKPFYYYFRENKLVFASEIKAILPALSSKPKANIPRLLDNILYGAFDHTEETMFQDIVQLRPGYMLEFDITNNKLKDEQYYDINSIKQTNNIYEKSVAKFKELFIDAVRLRLRSDVPVGSCLSGGLDSSSIVCVTSELLKNTNVDIRHDTISSCYDKKEERIYDEQEYIEEVVNATNVNAHKIYPSVDDFFNNIDKIIYHQDEPVGGLCHEAQNNVFSCAREQGLTVMLDGQGADEQLAGYTAFYSMIIREYLRNMRFISAIRELKHYMKRRNDSERYGLKGVLWFIGKDILPLSIRRFFIKVMTKREEYEWIKVPHDNSLVEKLRRYNSFDDYTKKSMKYGLVMLLHYEDRNSMAHSVEGRLPFLDYRLVEHIISLSPEQKIKDGITKRILRDAMDGVLPDKIKNRMSKLGFAVPVDLWVTEYPELIKSELEAALDNLSSIIEKKKVLEWFEKNKYNKLALINDTLWRIICTGRWLNIFNIEIERTNK